MYVRWQKRNLRDGGFSLNAVLVENRRVNGKPVQHHVAYLGSINRAKDDRAMRVYFWDHITKRLDELQIVERRKIEAAIAKKVPRLTKREFATWQRERQTFEDNWRKFFQGPATTLRTK